MSVLTQTGSAMISLPYRLLSPPAAPPPCIGTSHLSLKTAQGLHKESGPAYMQHWCGTALLPFADAIIESQQVGKALWVLEGRTLALGALNKREDGEKISPGSLWAKPWFQLR